MLYLALAIALANLVATLLVARRHPGTLGKYMPFCALVARWGAGIFAIAYVALGSTAILFLDKLDGALEAFTALILMLLLLNLMTLIDARRR